MSRLVQRGARGGAVVFLIFAATYFLSALLRAVTATLAPQFSAEFQLGAADLGLLAGAYFLGFSLLQLPLGSALDRWGPRRVEVGLLAVAVLGCMLFASATGFVQLVLARVLIGMGVAACLMAPLTYFRRHLPPTVQLRLNSWMLMTGSLGMVASTVPVQLLLPTWGWRGLFWALAVLLALGAWSLHAGLPDDDGATPLPGEQAAPASYAPILRHPEFVRVAPLGLVLYGGMIAIQALWAGPWLTQVRGLTPGEASQGLLLINSGMLVAFLGWGWVMPSLARRGVQVRLLVGWGVSINLVLLSVILWLGHSAGAVHWMAWCVSASVVSLAQPALAQVFPVHMAGRALSAFNLVVFVGVFVLQWGMGAGIDLLRASGVNVVDAFRLTGLGFLVLVAASHAWYVAAPGARVHNAAAKVST